MHDEFDPHLYVRPPVLKVSGAVALARALLAAAPREASVGVAKAAAVLRTKTIALQQAWGDREKQTKPPDPRPADRAMDTSWSALHGRLEGYALLPTDEYPRASRAQELLDTLFPDGLTFLRLAYAEEWAESEKRLKRVDDEKLAHDVDVLCGPEFLAEVRRQHLRYGDAIGVTKAVAVVERNEGALADPLRAVTRAIGQYAIQIVATVDAEQPASVTAARAALAPLDRYRGAASRKGKTEEQAPTPESPLPSLPDSVAKQL